MKLTMLGTGNAMTVRNYNTCFVLSDGDRHLLVDAGGGNGVLTRLSQAGLDWRDVREMFVTHHHIDHFMGAVWMVRMAAYACQRGAYDGVFTVYGNSDAIGLLDSVCRQLLNPGESALIGSRVRLVPVRDGQRGALIGREAVFFDIHSPRLVQYGFTLDISHPGSESGRRLACCGDEPFHEPARPYVEGCEWLLHEAFCLHEEAEVYHPYGIFHSTVKDACDNARGLGARKLLLYHTEEQTEPHRVERYLREAARFFDGYVVVPADLDVIDLDEG